MTISYTRILNQTLLNEINEKMGEQDFSEKYPEVYFKWQQLRSRSWVYLDLKDYDKFNFTWFRRAKIFSRLQDIQLGIDALCALEHENHLRAIQDELSWLIRRIFEAELCYLELKQYKNLVKDQSLHRPDIIFIQDSLKHKMDLLRAELKSKQFTKHLKSAVNPKIHLFFKRYERFYFDFDATILRSQRAGDIVSAFSSSVNIGRSIPMIHAMVTGVALKLLIAIPAASALSGAAPIFLGTARAWMESYNLKRKLVFTGMTIVVAIGIALAFTVPVATLIIAGTFVGLSAAKEYALPSILLTRLIYKKENALKQLKDEISQKTSSHEHASKLDKSILLKKLEYYCVQKNNIAPKLIWEAKNLIANDPIRVANLLHNTLLQTATGCRCEQDLKKILLQQSKCHQRLLEHEIKELRTKRNKNIVLTINGVISTTAALLFCVPTPVTMIIGASIYAASMFFSIAYRYDWYGKIKNAISPKPDAEIYRFNTNSILQELPQNEPSEEEVKVNLLVDPPPTPPIPNDKPFNFIDLEEQTIPLICKR